MFNCLYFLLNILQTNTYSLIIISNGILSYAIMQYSKVQWNEENAPDKLFLPPEAGIFMRPLGGYQLPRSGHQVQPILWTQLVFNILI